MPYNTTEGQLVIDLLTNIDNLELSEIIGCEPVEYSDKYNPSKYGIIFKEKIIASQNDPTLISLNVRLLCDGKDFEASGLMKHFCF